MALVQFNRRPFETSFDSLFNDLIADMPVLFKNGKNDSAWKGFVPANVKESEKNYSIELVAPGFDKADFKVNVEQDILTVSAEKKNEAKNDAGNQSNEKEIRREYHYRSFKRSFTLNDSVNAENIEAKYVNGVLTLNLPKKEEVKTASKEISIQ
jgi:HSP20 family protein